MELVGQLLVQERRANLGSRAAGSFSLVSHYGGKQLTIDRSGSRLAECLAQPETRLPEHMTRCARAVKV